MLKVVYTETFLSSYEKFPKKLQIQVKKKIVIFEKNQKHPSLHCHKLHGDMNSLFSFSVTMSIRIIFTYGKEGQVYFLKVGDHGMYQ